LEYPLLVAFFYPINIAGRAVLGVVQRVVCHNATANELFLWHLVLPEKTCSQVLAGICAKFFYSLPADDDE
jgi:hypothetical protein